jgi:hypothetical protein
MTAGPLFASSCLRTRPAVSIWLMEDGQPQSRTHLRFVWTANGYELREREGEPPGIGEEVEEGAQRLRVTKIAPSPLPGDSRRCAYLQPLT